MDNYSFSFSGPSWPTQVRSFLSQFFDAFSAFSKHIAPTYRHDRCERGVNGDAQTLVKSDNPELSPEMHNRTRRLRCSEKCEDLIVMHLGFLDYSYYFITIRFYDLEEAKFNIRSITFDCMFAHSLRKFSVRDWSIEQKWMSILLPLLLLYNDPLFPLTFLVNSWIPGMFDGLFQASFLSALLLFWLCVYHGVRQKMVLTNCFGWFQTNRRFARFYLPKLLLVGLLWITAVTLASWQEYNELHDPTYYYRLDASNFVGFKIFFFVIGGIYLLFLIYLLIRAYAELRQMPYFDLRLKFMTALMVIVIGITIAIVVMRFGEPVQNRLPLQLMQNQKAKD
nr:hypothetical protein BaRGS_013746 [Batillaria attramentaria]